MPLQVSLSLGFSLGLSLGLSFGLSFGLSLSLSLSLTTFTSLIYPHHLCLRAPPSEVISAEKYGR